MTTSQFQAVDDVELRSVQGGGLFSWIRKAVNAVEGVIRSVGQPWT